MHSVDLTSEELTERADISFLVEERAKDKERRDFPGVLLQFSTLVATGLGGLGAFADLKGVPLGGPTLVILGTILVLFGIALLILVTRRASRDRDKTIAINQVDDPELRLLAAHLMQDQDDLNRGLSVHALPGGR
ncbi:hypothetical protein [Actinoplanes aureus]|uniref:Uncharacterized protein n=1 Tax=Actinoplanes aureus TaxID=2792083 RepID=A0A931G2C9_9ACTN|nr:hypothetical protein [Actinoplanes aureus]MBG0563174.1 hypothetical protein [Actinoplanes aureus]